MEILEQLICKVICLSSAGCHVTPIYPQSVLETDRRAWPSCDALLSPPKWGSLWSSDVNGCGEQHSVYNSQGREEMMKCHQSVTPTSALKKYWQSQCFYNMLTNIIIYLLSPSY